MAQTQDPQENSLPLEPPEDGEDEQFKRVDSLNELELEKQVQDKELTRVINELARAQKIASIYIDNRSGGAYFNAETKVRGDVVGRDQKKSKAISLDVDVIGNTVNHILPTDIEKISVVYVKPKNYETIQKALEKEHLVILRGVSHMGKRTTALHLLASNKKIKDTIFELDPTVSIRDFDFSKSPPQGYLIDSYAPEDSAKFSDFHFSNLSQYLEKIGAFLVITINESENTDIGVGGPSQYIIDWHEFPDPNSVILKHINYYSPNSFTSKKAQALLNVENVKEFVLDINYPGDLDRLAELLVDVALEKLDISEALERFNANADQQIKKWFEEYTDPRDHALLLSVAVYSGASYQIVFDAEKRLLALSEQSEENDKPMQSIFSPKRSQRLQRIGATSLQGYEETEFGRSPVEIITLNNPAMQPAILKYMWREASDARDILINWLSSAVVDAPYAARIRAAAAVGEIAKHDFRYIQKDILLRWASRQNASVRAAAAFALGIPAWDSESAPLVLGLLHHWSTVNNWRLGWTAATAYGGLAGIRFPDRALQDLRQIANHGDARLFGVILQSTSNLFRVGEDFPEYRIKILAALRAWTVDKKEIITSMGLYLFIHLTRTANIKADPDNDYWPFLLWILQEGDPIENIIVELWRRAFNLKATRSVAMDAMENWFKTVEQDNRLYEKLEWLANEIAFCGVEREALRFKSFLNHLERLPDTQETASKIILSIT